MDALDIAALAEACVGELSGGQAQRTAIARALAMQPDILLLDEPTVGQDRKNLKRMIEALNRLNQEEGCAIITVTHDSACAAALADRTARMEQGVIRRTGGEEVIA
jgi:energy-coupling factor transporter ATP-binding protein EcfA2